MAFGLLYILCFAGAFLLLLGISPILVYPVYKILGGKKSFKKFLKDF